MNYDTQPTPVPQQSDPVAAATTGGWYIASPSGGKPVRFDTFEAAMEKLFEGYNVPVFYSNGTPERFSDAHERVGLYFAKKPYTVPPSPAPAGPTPRTDAVLHPISELYCHDTAVFVIAHAQLLERELTDALRQRDEARKEVEETRAKAKETAKDFETAFRVVRQENDKLQKDTSREMQIQLMASRSNLEQARRDLSSLQAQATRDAEEIKRLREEVATFCEEMSNMFGKNILRLGDAACFMGHQSAEIQNSIAALSATEAECARLKEARDHNRICVERLTKERDDECAKLREEKERRIYYQDIVYFVCNILDQINGKRPGTGIACGSYGSATKEVQFAMTQIKSERDAATARVAALEKTYNELIYQVGNKHPGETQHQTALRYIKRAEETVTGPSEARALAPTRTEGKA